MGVSGERKITLPEGSVSRVTDQAENSKQGAAIYSREPTTFEGNGSLYVTGAGMDGIFAESNALYL